MKWWRKNKGPGVRAPDAVMSMTVAKKFRMVKKLKRVKCR
jgi:hypothetical protein